MDFSSDEILGTLGGSLMKDLLADLQVDEGDFSLDQLEKELATLDQDPPQFQTQPLPALNAASLVVSHAQQRSAGAPPVPATPPSGQGMDAWSLSLQNFTAMSLQDDFLAADSARKMQQHAPPPDIQPVILEGAEDYDIGEKSALSAPPGLGSSKPPGIAKETPAPSPFPKTPQNSVNIPYEQATKSMQDMGVVPAVPAPPHQPTAAPAAQGMAPPVEVLPPQNNRSAPPPASIPPQANPVSGGPHPGADMPPPNGQMPMHPQMMNHQNMHPTMRMPPQMMPPQGHPQPVVMATPAGSKGPAWQTPRALMPQPIRAFCNPHPAAPPIPATALESKYMTARDVAYVVHAILKPVLAEGISENDYYIQFLRRLGGDANLTNPKEQKDMNEEMLSRSTKSKEWSSEKGVLGHVTKASVTRPRALIATPMTTSSEQDSEHKQRATLWKARIYCDQAYQSYQMVVDIWRSAPPGGVPPQVQMHLVKLMKCMGITHIDKEYQVDKDSLGLLIKLNKGRTLIARIMEQALLPPNVVQAVLPSLLDVLMISVGKKSGGDRSEDMSNERLFRAITTVLQKLKTSSDTLLECLKVVQKSGKTALASAARMECAHTLLQKGSMVVGQDPSEEKRAAWGKAEGEFMTLLQAY